MEVEGSAMIAAAAALVALSLSLSVSGTWSGGCSEELLSFSACLPYVSSPPNNLTDMASLDCCNAVHRFQSRSLCLCYLLRDPNFLGFPLNTTSLLSLSSLCPPLPSLNLLCSASPSLPPLNSPTAAAAAPPPGESSGRMVPSSSGGGILNGAPHFPILNGAVATSSTNFWNTLQLLLAILVSATSTL